MVNVIKQEVRMEESLRKRLEFICEFCIVKTIIINGNLRTIDKTNLTYLEPHRIIINDITFLAFNYSNEIFIEKLNVNIKLDVMNYSEEKIREFFASDSMKLDVENDLGIKSIHLDTQIYGLESIYILKKIGTPFMSEDEINNKIKKETKRDNIAQEILKYKRKLDTIDAGTFGNDDNHGQLSGGRHI